MLARRLPWWAIGMSLVATDIGATDIIGVGGASYTFGLAVANFEWIGCVPQMVLAAFVFIPFFWRAGVCTIPEYMERRFNVGVRTSLGLCWIAFMACNLGIMLFASAKMSSVLFGWNQAACVLLAAMLVGFYTIVGGLAAVVYTDTIQCAVMIGGCLLVLVLGVIDLGGIGPFWAKVQALGAAEQGLADASLAAVERTSLGPALAARGRHPAGRKRRGGRQSQDLGDPRTAHPDPDLLVPLKAVVLTPAATARCANSGSLLIARGR